MQKQILNNKPSLLYVIIIASSKGARIAIIAAALYLLALSILIPIYSIISDLIQSSAYPNRSGFDLMVVLRHSRQTILLVWFIGGVIGTIPTLLLGSLNGAVLASMVYMTHTKLPKNKIILIALLISISMVASIGLYVYYFAHNASASHWYMPFLIPPAIIYITLAGIYSAKAYEQIQSY